MTYTLDEVIEITEKIDKLIERSEFHKDVTEYLKQYREMLWHYPARGELPDKDVECLVLTKSGNKFIAMIDSADNCWCTGEFFSEYLRDDCIVCWQYIVPPEVKE